LVRDAYGGISRIVESNVRYLAHLTALRAWYLHVRKETFRDDDLGDWIYAGALDKLLLARKERVQRLTTVAEKMPRSIERQRGERQKAVRRQLYENIEPVCALFDTDTVVRAGVEHRDRFLSGLHDQMKHLGSDHVRLIQGLSPSLTMEGTHWLNAIVHKLCQETSALLPSLRIFRESV